MAETKLLGKRYLLEKTLGTGGMAVVYRAHDLTLDRTVAVKVLREDYSRDPAFRERFRHEAMAAAKLSHPNIVTVHDFGIDGEQLFFVMEYVPGTTLHAVMQKRGRLTVEETLHFIRQACAGIGYAHRAGLVHCDIKPQNFLITPDNRLKVADFGIARALAYINPAEKAEVVWGSPQYFSPEQAAGAAPSPASDVYSIGVVMYAMLTGRLPFTAATAAELAELHRTALPTPPRQFNPSIPIELELILLKILSKEPSARYRTAGQLEKVLESISSKEKVSPAEPDRPVLRQASASRPAPSIQPEKPAQPPGMHPAAVQEIVTPRSAAAVDSQREARDNLLDIDWVSLVLGLIALIAVGGLIPFWLWIYLLYNPPVR